MNVELPLRPNQSGNWNWHLWSWMCQKVDIFHLKTAHTLPISNWPILTPFWTIGRILFHFGYTKILKKIYSSFNFYRHFWFIWSFILMCHTFCVFTQRCYIFTAIVFNDLPASSLLIYSPSIVDLTLLSISIYSDSRHSFHSKKNHMCTIITVCGKK